jgi:LuxR family maltose regulon positive regulatory protein
VQSPPFAATKIQRPQPRGVRIARPRLEAALDEALATRRVVLLQAQAGFGKTSLLAARLAALPVGTAAAWVALDDDDDCARLFACLAAALEPFDLPWRSAPEGLAARLEGDAEGARRAAVELVNALAQAEVPHGVIALDDLHRVQSPAVHRLLDGLIERLPPQWTLAIATRLEPPLALARWRAAGELAEFLLDDLRFTPDEARALATAEAGADTPLGDLLERTQGWPAGLRLALAARRTRAAVLPAATPGAPRAGSPGGAARGSAAADRPLFDYLAAEVLDDMPTALHDFLVRCAVLPVLTAGRCAAVAGDARAADRLDEIERRGLFATVLDGPEQAIVLHDLFRDALDDRLRKRFPTELPVLLQRAAAGEDDPVRRVGFLLRAGDWAAAEAALAGTADELVLDGQTAEVQRLVDGFPAAWREASPALLRLAALVDALRWNWNAMARHAEAAVAAATRRGDTAALQLAQGYLLSAWNATGRTDRSEALLATLDADAMPPHAAALVLDARCTLHFRRGDHAALPELFGRVMDRLAPLDALLPWWECSPPTSWAGVHGLGPVLQRWCAEARRRLGDRALTMGAMLRSLEATIAFWAGDVDRALAEAREAEADARWLAASTEIALNLAVLRVLADAVRGRAARVHAALEALWTREDGIAAPDRLQVWHEQVAVFGLRAVDTLGGDADALALWAGRLAPAAPAGSDAPDPRGARLAAAQGRWSEAADAFAALLPQVERFGLMGQSVELRLRAAHALQRAGRAAEAAAPLRAALAQVNGHGEAGHALMAGDGVLAQLARADASAALPAPLAATLAALAAQAAALRSGAAALPTQAPAGNGDGNGDGNETADDGLLSQRERAVLERIAAGESNKLIARALDISPHTVKRHVANILDKLGLGSRGQAAAWLREHPRG